MKKAKKSTPFTGSMKPVTRAASRVAIPHELKEILNFPAKLLIELPIPTYLTMKISGIDSEVFWSTGSREDLPDPGGKPVFDGSELDAMIMAAESERAWKRDLVAWISAKRNDPGFRIDLETAMAGAVPVSDQHWSVGRLLQWYGCELVGIEIARTPVEGASGFDAAA